MSIMPHELSIQARPPIAAAHGRSSAPKPDAPVETVKPAQPYNNPDLRLDPALGLVVIEFHDGAGKLTSSIPSQRQIDAYRLHDKPPGQAGVQPRKDSIAPDPTKPEAGDGNGKTPAG